MHKTLRKHIENNDLKSFEIESQRHYVSDYEFCDLFIFSAELGCLDILKYLRSRHRFNTIEFLDFSYVKKNQKYYYKEAAFVLAAQGGHTHVIKYLFRINPKIDYRADNNKALCAAAGAGHFDIVKLLIEQNDLNPQYKERVNITDINTAYEGAVKNGHLPTLQFLETLNDPNFDYTVRNVNTFRSACNRGQIAIVEHFLNNPFINPAADDFVALRGAIGWKAENSQDVIQLLAQWLQKFGSKEECERQDKILEAYGITIKESPKAKTSTTLTFGAVSSSTDSQPKEADKGKQVGTPAQSALPDKKDKEPDSSQRQSADLKEELKDEQKAGLFFRYALREAAHPRRHERRAQGHEHQGHSSHTERRHDERRTHHKSGKGAGAHP